MMRILVTGAAGFIGSHLCERLVADGRDVLGVDCFTDYYDRRLKEMNAADVRAAGVDLLEHDLAEDDLSDALDGVEAVYHCAAQPGIASHVSFETYLRNNVTATHRLLEAAARLGTLRIFVNIATSSVYGKHATDDENAAPKPTSWYGVTKLAAEQLCLAAGRDRGVPACSLRLFSVYGPRERPEKLYPKLIRAVLRDEEFPLFSGSREHRRSYTYVDDAVRGMLAVLDRIDVCSGEILNIGSDIETTTGHGIEIVEGLLGASARIAEKPARPGDQLRTHADIEKAKRLLDWSPVTPPEDGLRATVEWFRERLGDMP